MSKRNIPVFNPYFTESEFVSVKQALELRWLGPGSYVKEFEESIADLINVLPEQVVAVNTGTSAVHLALELAGVTHGDEVITPSFNNIADFHAIRYTGAEPVFCDVKERDLTIDPYKIESLITDKTKAILALDYGSALFDYDSVKLIAEQNELQLIYDACHSFGSRNLNGMMVGEIGDITAFSFDPVKNITCIDGGAVVVRNIEHAQKLRYKRQLGQKQNQSMLYQNGRSFTYDVDDIGYRYHLANLHAAIGVEQIKKLDFMKEARQKIFLQYHEGIDNQYVRLPEMISTDIFPFIFVVRVLKDRNKFIEYCCENGVDTGIHWQPGHLFSFYSHCKSGNLDVTNKIGTEIVTLPMYPDLSDDDISTVINVINDYKG